MEQKYALLKTPLLEKRRDIVSGEVDVDITLPESVSADAGVSEGGTPAILNIFLL